MTTEEKIWTYSYSSVKEVFLDFIQKNYPGYKLIIDWSDFKDIEDYLMRLMLNSYHNSVEVREQLPALINDVEMFFATSLGYKFINANNLTTILNVLKDKDSGFRAVEFLPLEFRGVYGKSVGNRIQINPDMTRHQNSPSLTADEVKCLYMFHEIGHKVLRIRSRTDVIDKYTNTIKSVLESKGMYDAELSCKSYIYNGFLMIEECLTQELAEYLLYYAAGKDRPSYEYRRDTGCTVYTNLDYYGIFQMPTINLGKTMRGISSGKTNEEILLNMIRRALNSNFPLELISEYNQGDANLYYNLFTTLRTMGMIQINKYASFGIGRAINIDTQICLNSIAAITARNRDLRPYPVNGFPPIDFDSFNPPGGPNGSFNF